MKHSKKAKKKLKYHQPKKPTRKKRPFIPHIAPVDTDFLLSFYDAYTRSPNIAKIAASLEISPNALNKRLQEYPELQRAKEIADSKRSTRSLSGYVFANLTKEAQEIWDQVQKSANLDTITKIFSRKTKEIHQELFIYALVNSSFDLSTACRMVGLNRGTLTKWRSDLEFMQLLEEVQWHKKNFFESALCGLVEERHPGAVIFVNRTVNADRGYSEKLQIEHSTSGQAGSYGIEDLNLDLETRKKILAAIRERQNQQKQLPPPPEPPTPPTIDVQAEAA